MAQRAAAAHVRGGDLLVRVGAAAARPMRGEHGGTAANHSSPVGGHHRAGTRLPVPGRGPVLAGAAY